MASEVVVGIDGLTLSEAQLRTLCTPEFISRASKPVVGCVLSCVEASRRIAQGEDRFGIVIQDDAILPREMPRIADKLEKVMQEDEVVLLFYSPYSKILLSRQDVTWLGVNDPYTGKPLALYYPMSLEGIFSALAYCVGKEAAAGIVRSNTPVSFNADLWSSFYERKAFRKLRILYPPPVRRMAFNSSLSPYPQNSLHKLISYLAYGLKLPPFYQYLTWRERVLTERLWQRNIQFVDERSPLAEVEPVRTINRVSSAEYS